MEPYLLTIYDNYTAPPKPGQLQFDSSAYSVGESGGSVKITVSRTDGSEGTVSVVYVATEGIAKAGSDFSAVSGTLTFAAGETNKSFSVGIVNDSIAEPGETFTVSLKSPTGGSALGTPVTATVSIVDDDGDTLYLQNETVITTETYSSTASIWA